LQKDVENKILMDPATTVQEGGNPGNGSPKPDNNNGGKQGGKARVVMSIEEAQECKNLVAKLN
jgi:hypothetical protein